MSLATVDARSSWWHKVAWLIIAAAIGIVVVRIATVKSKRGGTAMLSANDRSRWATIRSMVDHHSYAIDRVIFRAPGKRDPEWYTIDLVRHRGPDGREHYYSSKPTVLTTVLAGPYWLIQSVTGWTLATHPLLVMRIMLILVNALPMLLYLLMVTRLSAEWSSSSFTRIFVVASAALATPLSTFAVTLNNHFPAAFGVLIATWATWRIWRNNRGDWWPYFVAGGASAWAATCDLPALSFFAIVLAALFLRSARATSLAFVPPAALVFAAAVGTNYLAHGVWSTPYAHRRDGPVVASLPARHAEFLRQGQLDESTRNKLAEQGLVLPSSTTIQPRAAKPGYSLLDPERDMPFAVETGEGEIRVRRWDNWYDYEGTYWAPDKKQGVDRGEPSKAVYAIHALIGHHGVFSLTPLWLFSIYGAARWVRRGEKVERAFALATILLTVVCLVFYIVLRPVEDRNYGGVSCCFRWTLWLVPLWLMCLAPAIDAVAARPTMKGLAAAFFLISAFSAFYSNNPWSHPWLFELLSHLGWIRY